MHLMAALTVLVYNHLPPPAWLPLLHDLDALHASITFAGRSPLPGWALKYCSSTAQSGPRCSNHFAMDSAACLTAGAASLAR